MSPHFSDPSRSIRSSCRVWPSVLLRPSSWVSMETCCILAVLATLALVCLGWCTHQSLKKTFFQSHLSPQIKWQNSFWKLGVTKLPQFRVGKEVLMTKDTWYGRGVRPFAQRRAALGWAVGSHPALIHEAAPHQLHSWWHHPTLCSNTGDFSCYSEDTY